MKPLSTHLEDRAIHLLLPFCSSLLVVLGLLCLQRVQERGVSTWTSMIVVCWSSALVFPLLALRGGQMQSPVLLWQPAIIGALFLTGQLLTFMAVQRGDVSVAAPVLGVKVLMVPALAGFFVDEQLSIRVWIAAAVALVGIVFVQARDDSIDRSRIAASVGYALAAAFAMTLFDLLIQRWAPAWGAGYFLPLAFGFSALLSLAFLPLANRPVDLARWNVGRLLGVGALLMAIQAIGMTFTIGAFGDATRVNIVYSLRGLWGVVLAWALARRLANSASAPTHRTMLKRLLGALLIGVAVIISVGTDE